MSRLLSIVARPLGFQWNRELSWWYRPIAQEVTWALYSHDRMAQIMKDVQTEMLLSVMEEPVVDADGVVYLFNTSMDLLNPFDQNWLWGKRGFSGEWRLHEVVDTGVLILSVYPTLGQES